MRDNESAPIAAISIVFFAFLTALLGGCGGHSSNQNTHTIAASVTGLLSGNVVVLENNGGDNLTATGNGSFNFSTSLHNGQPYAVTVSTQPAGQNCTVTNGAGTVASANVSGVTVTCSDNTYNVGVTVTGLPSPAANLVLQDNGADNLTITANGTFNFNTPVASGAAYAVTVLNQPVGQSCVAANASGNVSTNNVNVQVNCNPTPYTIGVNVTGLLSGNSVILQDNGADNLTVTTNGSATFATPVGSGLPYAVTVASQPAGQNCTITNASGTVGTANVTTVSMNCATNTYNVNVTVSGLPKPTGLVLQNNGTDNLPIATSGTFNFNTPVASGSPYAVTVLNAPTGHSCIVTGASGTIGSSNVNVNVTCPWHIAYVVDPGSNNISAYYIDGATGSLSPLPNSPYGAQGSPTSIAITPNGNFAYVSNATSNNISAFQIDPVTGDLNAVPGSPFPSGKSPGHLTIAPNGQFVFVSNVGDNTLSAYAVNGSTGALTPITGSPLAIAGNPAFDSTGQFIYVFNPGVGNIAAYSVSATTGSLTAVPGSPFTINTGSSANTAVGITTAPTLGNLYVQLANGQTGGGVIQVFAINATTGAITPALVAAPAPAPAPAPAVASPIATTAVPNTIVFDQSSPLALVFGSTSTAAGPIIAAYSVDAATGLLTLINSYSPGPYAGTFGGFAIDPSGSYLYGLENIPTIGYGTDVVLGYTLNAATGAVSAINQVTTFSDSSALTPSASSIGIK